MIKYLIGFLKNIFNPAISNFAIIDNSSKLSRTCRIYRKVKIYKSSVGSYSYIGPRTRLVLADIGNYCSIAEETLIGLGNHTLNFISTSPIFTERKNGTNHSWIEKDIIEPLDKTVIIGNDVWIGTRVIILSGVRVGDGAIIGAGSIVTKDVPDFAIVAGIPAKIIRYRFDNEIISELKTINWWNYGPESLKKNISHFQTSDFSLQELNKLKSLLDETIQ